MRKFSAILLISLLLFTAVAASATIPPKNIDFTPVSIDPARYFPPQEKSGPKDPSLLPMSNMPEVPPPPVPSEESATRTTKQLQTQPAQDRYPDPDIYEPDDTPGQATLLTFNTTLQSQQRTFHSWADEDWFRFYGVAGVRYVFFSASYGTDTANPRIRIYDDVFVYTIAQDDDSGFGSWQFYLEFTPTETRYHYGVFEHDNPGNYMLYYTYGTPADDYEVDNTSSQATALNPLGFVDEELHTLHSTTDYDWFIFPGYAGITYNFFTNGSTDTIGQIFASNGTTVLALDDDSGDGYNFSISFTCSETSTYYLRIYGFGGNTGFYFLRYNSSVPPDAYEPDDDYASYNSLSVTPTHQTRTHSMHSVGNQDWFRFYGYAGRRYIFYSSSPADVDFKLFDDNLTQIGYDYTIGDFYVEIELPAAGYYRFYASDSSGGGYYYQLVYYYEYYPDSYEPDDSASDCTNLITTTVPQTQSHTLHSVSDQDWYRFEGIPGRLYIFYSTGSTDTQIFLYQDDGITQLANNDDSGDGLNYRLEFAPAAYAYYKLKVIPYTGNAGPYGFVYYHGATPDAYEPDDVYSQSTTLIPASAFQSQPHTLHDGTDEDWFVFYAYAGRTYTFYSSGNTDVRAYLYNAELTQFGFNDDGAGYPNFLLQLYPTISGLIYIKVNGYNGAVGAYDINYNYTLGSISPPLLVSIVLVGDQIYLDWAPVLNATSYRVEASDNPQSGFVPVATVTSSSWTTGATYAKKFYRVIAQN
ncbi:MAG: hypothetical protein K0B87_07920 [Candidatus Syntrophosphaera sp.]|nr:hypothetical protein [Candidatus Syntrophosphaera sp.]